MMRLVAGLAALAALGAAGAQAATSSAPSSSSSVAVSTTLAPGKAHEACMGLSAGDKRRWYWKSDAPVDFTIHYHDNGTMRDLVTRNAMRGDGGTFTAQNAGAYCWTWRASKPAKLEGKIETP
jgi:hypothetical protein